MFEMYKTIVKLVVIIPLSLELLKHFKNLMYSLLLLISIIIKFIVVIDVRHYQELS